MGCICGRNEDDRIPNLYKNYPAIRRFRADFDALALHEEDIGRLYHLFQRVCSSCRFFCVVFCCIVFSRFKKYHDAQPKSRFSSKYSESIVTLISNSYYSVSIVKLISSNYSASTVTSIFSNFSLNKILCSIYVFCHFVIYNCEE